MFVDEIQLQQTDPSVVRMISIGKPLGTCKLLILVSFKSKNLVVSKESKMERIHELMKHKNMQLKLCKMWKERVVENNRK